MLKRIVVAVVILLCGVVTSQAQERSHGICVGGDRDGQFCLSSEDGNICEQLGGVCSACPPEYPGTCFVELGEAGPYWANWGIPVRDHDGDLVFGLMTASGPQDFMLVTPSTPPGFITMHLVENEATLLACRAGLCGSEVLVGSGHVMATGQFEMPAPFFRCPSVVQINGTVEDPTTGETFKVNGTMVMPADPNTEGVCGVPARDASVLEVRIRPTGGN